MSAITGQPKGTMTLSQAIRALGMSKLVFIKSGLSEFLEYHQVGRSKLYRSEDVYSFKYYLLVQRGLAALGLTTPSPPAPLLPPGETMQAKRINFDAWIDEDNFGAACPKCGGVAVQDTYGTGRAWCPDCGINE